MEQPQRSWQEQPPQLCPGRAEFPVGSARGRGSTPRGSCLVPSLLAAEVFRSCAVILGSSAIVWLPEGCWAGVGSLSSDSLMNSRPANEDWLRASSLASALRQEKGFTGLSGSSHSSPAQRNSGKDPSAWGGGVWDPCPHRVWGAGPRQPPGAELGRGLPRGAGGEMWVLFSATPIYIQLWGPQIKEDMDLLVQIQRRP